MTAAVHARDVTVKRNGATLLDRVTIEAAPGGVVAIVGPNGAGKTTLLGVLAGDIAPSSGTARVLDHDPARMSPDRLARARAYLGPQEPTDIMFTVRDVVEMGRHPHRRAMLEPAAHDEIVDDAMVQTDVAHLAGRVARDLSTGEMQRVGLARVLAQRTPVLLLDEPTAVLDVGHQEMIMRRLRAASLGGTTVVVVLHDLNLAAAHADHLLLLDRGSAITAGPATSVLTGDNLSTAYRQPMVVVPHPHRDCPLVLTVD